MARETDVGENAAAASSEEKVPEVRLEFESPGTRLAKSSPCVAAPVSDFQASLIIALGVDGVGLPCRVMGCY